MASFRILDVCFMLAFLTCNMLLHEICCYIKQSSSTLASGSIYLKSMSFRFYEFLPESNWRPRAWQSRALTNWNSFTSSRMLFQSVACLVCIVQVTNRVPNATGFESAMPTSAIILLSPRRGNLCRCQPACGVKWSNLVTTTLCHRADWQLYAWIRMVWGNWPTQSSWSSVHSRRTCPQINPWAKWTVFRGLLPWHLGISLSRRLWVPAPYRARRSTSYTNYPCLI